MKVICDETGNKRILLSKDIDTSFSAHSLLSHFTQEVESIKGQKLIVDFQGVRFIASNQFAILGCIMNGFIIRNKENSLLVEGLSDKIKNIVRKNGFSRHLGIEKLPDEHNTVIPYRFFGVDQINEYEKYLTLSLFGREDLPQMSQMVKNSIQDYLLEIFKNVKDHTTSDYIFTCGQFPHQENFCILQ